MGSSWQRVLISYAPALAKVITFQVLWSKELARNKVAFDSVMNLFRMGIPLCEDLMYLPIREHEAGEQNSERPHAAVHPRAAHRVCAVPKLSHSTLSCKRGPLCSGFPIGIMDLDWPTLHFDLKRRPSKTRVSHAKTARTTSAT